MVAAIARIKHKGILRNYDAFGVFLLSRLNQSNYNIQSQERKIIHKEHGIAQSKKIIKY